MSSRRNSSKHDSAPRPSAGGTRAGTRHSRAPVPRPWLHITLTLPLLLTGCEGAEGRSADIEVEPGVTVIRYRQFSAAPSLGNGTGASDPLSEDYGALRVFLERVEAATKEGDGGGIRFVLSDGASTLGAVANNEVDAIYVAGGTLNSVWGFVYNSVPFGPTFEQMIDFLHRGGGVELANRLLAERGVDVVAFPVVGSPAQMSGYFRKPVGVPSCPATGDSDCIGYGAGIGLRGMCGEDWTLRYLPPAETIVDRACDEFPSPQRLRFVQAIPGGSAFLTAIQNGTIDGLEFATPLDDFDAARAGFFANASAPEGSDGRNIGEVGLRFAHYPAWHQPFYLGWLVINRSQVWDRLDSPVQAAIRAAASQSVVESYTRSSSVQCDHLTRILSINDGRKQQDGNQAGDPAGTSADVILTEWPPEDLQRLRAATLRFLEEAGGADSPSEAEADYRTVITALREHLQYDGLAEMLEAWEAPDLPVSGGCADLLVQRPG